MTATAAPVTVREEDRVNTPSPGYLRMKPAWDLIDDLLGGTRAMRAAGEKWLPKTPGEQKKPELWDWRRDVAVLFPGLEKAVERVAGKPFAKTISVKNEDKISESLTPLLDDVDGRGTNLTQFGRSIFCDAVARGLTHVLVDAPRGKAANLREQRERGIRPRFVHVTPRNLLGGVIAEDDESGAGQLMQIRIRERRVEMAGDFGQVEVDYIRVWNAPGFEGAGFPVVDDPTVSPIDNSKGTWQLWRKPPEKSEYEPHSQGSHDFDGVPLVSIYLNKTGELEAEAPFEHVAHLNIAHWQSTSRQRTYLEFVRMAVLFGWGFTGDEKDRPLQLGLGEARLIEDEGDLKYVEHSGAAAKAGTDDLDRLKEEMGEASLEPFVRRTGNPTATGRALDEAKNQPDVQAWVRALEMGVRQCFEFAAQWMGEELHEEVAFDVWSEFNLALGRMEDLKELREDRAAGNISHKLYLEERKRRGLYNEDMDPEEEIEAVAEEGPPLGLVGVGGGGDNEGRDPDETARDTMRRQARESEG